MVIRIILAHVCDHPNGASILFFIFIFYLIGRVTNTIQHTNPKVKIPVCEPWEASVDWGALCASFIFCLHDGIYGFSVSGCLDVVGKMGVRE